MFRKQFDKSQNSLITNHRIDPIVACYMVPIPGLYQMKRFPEFQVWYQEQIGRSCHAFRNSRYDSKSKFVDCVTLSRETQIAITRAFVTRSQIVSGFLSFACAWTSLRHRFSVSGICWRDITRFTNISSANAWIGKLRVWQWPRAHN